MIGATISHYRVIERLGRGGMGVVYKAEDIRLGRIVALKFLSDALIRDRSALERFRREGRAASALDHPHICTVYDVDEHDGQPFIVMQFLEGQTLQERLADPLRPGEIVALGRQIAEALDAAHARGIVHRDIKPANIFVTTGGQAKVLDFGLAKLLERTPGAGPAATTEAPTAAGDDIVFTMPGAAIGTAPYMSPEQARGEPLDARTDLFSFGAVLYEMATGRRAFPGDTAAIVFNTILEKTPPSLLTGRPELPPALAQIVEKALEKDRRLRYQSAADLRSDLARLERDIASGSTPIASGPTTIASGTRGTRSRPLLALAACAGLLLLAAVAVWALWGSADRTAPIDSIAVLPFANASGDADAEYLSDGITESLISSLSSLRRLRVVPRSTVFRYKERDTDPRAVGRELNVRAVLTGRVTQRGDTLVIGVELVDVAQDSQLWGEQYSRRMADILTVQTDITHEISNTLRLQLTGDDERALARAYPRTTEAYDLYLKGLYHRQKATEFSFNESLRYFQQAIQQDPEFAPAHAGLSDTYNHLGYLSIRAPVDVWPASRAAALEALRLDDTLAAAHAALGATRLFYDRNPPGAKQAFDRAVELDPTHAITYHWYAHYWMAVNRWDEVRAAGRRAVEIDPLDLMLNAHLLFLESFLEPDTTRFLEDVRRVREIDPGVWTAHTTLGSRLVAEGRMDEGLHELETGAALSDGMPLALTQLGLGYASAGRRADAERVIARLEDKPYAPSMFITRIYSRLGDRDATFRWLEQGFQERAPEFASDLSNVGQRWPSDPRFEDLMRRAERAGMR